MKGPRVRALAWLVVMASMASLVVLGLSVTDSNAGMYTWVDDQGDRHVVDSREKVPAKYRTRAREVGGEGSRPDAQPSREAPRGDARHSSDAAGPRPQSPPAVPNATENRPDVISRPDVGWLDELRGWWVSGGAHLPKTGFSVGPSVPFERIPRMGLVAFGAALLVRGLSALRAVSAQRGLARFAIRYQNVLSTYRGRAEDVDVVASEADLPLVHRWVRAARIGPLTIGASREVGMGRVMDEGRVNVVQACLERADLVGLHVLTVLARAEGAHRHRARRPFSPLGWLETLAFLPRYLVWRGSSSTDGPVRVLLSLYWLVVLVWGFAG